jgi:outer membrane protein assembly factor BamB
VGNRIFITGTDEYSENEIFFAFTTSGEKLFSTEIGAAYTRSFAGARSTPTIVGNRAFVITGEGKVVAIDANNGSIIWTLDGNDFGMRVTTWGHAESPLVFDNKVIFTVGGDQTAMMAINADNGEVIWKSPPIVDEIREGGGFEASNYSSPILIEHNGVRQIVALAQWSLFGVNPDSGEIMWSTNEWGAPNRRISPNSPMFHAGHVFISNGYDLGAYKWRLNQDATGVTLVWRNDDLDTHHGGQVLLNGVLFGSSWINNNQGYWVAVDWNTGETLWEEHWHNKGQIIAADGMLIIYDDGRDTGYVGLVRPSRDGLQIVSDFQLPYGERQHWSHPVIHDGVLYIRRGTVLMGFRIR